MKISIDDISRLQSNLMGKVPKLQEMFELFCSCSKEELSKTLSNKEATVELLPNLRCHCMDAKVAGIHLRFQFLLGYNKNANIIGKVKCYELDPALLQTEKVKDVMGEFTFNSAGLTDIEDDRENDRLLVEQNASQIVLHFLHLSLGKPL